MKKFYIFDNSSGDYSVNFSSCVCVNGYVYIMNSDDIKNMTVCDRGNLFGLLCESSAVEHFAIVTEDNKTEYDIVKTAYDFANTDIDNIIENDVDVFSVSLPWCGTACRFPNCAMYYDLTDEFLANVICRMVNEDEFCNIADLLLDGDHLNG